MKRMNIHSVIVRRRIRKRVEWFSLELTWENDFDLDHEGGFFTDVHHSQRKRSRIHRNKFRKIAMGVFFCVILQHRLGQTRSVSIQMNIEMIWKFSPLASTTTISECNDSSHSFTRNDRCSSSSLSRTRWTNFQCLDATNFEFDFIRCCFE